MRTNRGCSCKLVFPLSALSNLPSSSFRPLVFIQTCWPSALWHFQKQKAIKYKHAVSVRFFFFHDLSAFIWFSSAPLRVAPRRPCGRAKLWWIIDRWQLHQSAALFTSWRFGFVFLGVFFLPRWILQRAGVGVVQTCLQIGTSIWTSGKKKKKKGRAGANTRSLRA